MIKQPSPHRASARWRIAWAV